MSAFDEGYRETWYRNADKALLILNYRVIVRLRRIHDGTYFFFHSNVRMTQSLR